jgi:hypothetical protein
MIQYEPKTLDISYALGIARVETIQPDLKNHGTDRFVEERCESSIRFIPVRAHQDQAVPLTMPAKTSARSLPSVRFHDKEP